MPPDIRSHPSDEASGRAGGTIAGRLIRRLGRRTERASPPTAASRRWRLSIYVLVLSMVIALAAPAAWLLGQIVEQSTLYRQQQVSIRGSQLAGEIADRVSQEVTSLRTILSVFAATGWIERDEMEHLHRSARRALAGTDRHLAVVNERSQPILSTRVDFGAPVAEPIEIGSASAGLVPGSSAVSDVLRRSGASTSVINVLQPVQISEGRRRFLVVSRDLDGLSVLGSTFGEANWSYAILDGTGQAATKVVSLGEAGTSVPDECGDGVMGFRTWGPPEETRYGFIRAIGGTPWSVCAWVSAERFAAQGEDLWATILDGAITWLGVALATTVLLSAAISRSIAATARIGETLQSGQEIPVPRSFIKEVDEVRRFLAGAAAERIRKEQRLELVLRETAHRAKNQLALAASLVDLSFRSALTTADLKDDLRGRLLALSRSVDALTSGRHDVAMLDQLIRSQLAPFNDQASARLQIAGPELAVSETAAQSLSLVFHELGTNASKYGGWSQPDGQVVIEWSLIDGDLCIHWTEHGALTKRSDRQGFGTVLLDTLIVKALRGAVEREIGSGGLSCTIRVPLTAVEPRS